MPEPGVQAAMKGLIVKDGKFLALQHKVGNELWWDIPGGRVAYGEDPKEGLKREIFEETKLNVEILKPLGVWHFIRQVDKAQVVCFTFLCSLKSEEIDIDNNPDDEERIIHHRWFTVEEFLKNTDAMTDKNLKKFISDYFY